ncbi:MAG: c-type cytochrome [Betaproteobacteria bacterium]|nr:c-type cytochrome [Betaproteobacteria bacterium]
MPAKGGSPSLSDADVKAAVDYMVAAVGGAKAEAKAETKPGAKPESKAASKVALAPAAAGADKGAGKAAYDKTCALCHGPGLAGAPKFGSKADWAPRLKAGTAKLHASALKGTPAGMPAKGGNPALSDGDVKAAVDYMLAAVGTGGQESAAAPPPAPAPAKVAAAAPVAVVPAPASPVAPPVVPLAVPAAAPRSSAAIDPNAFNRLLAAPGKRNAPPAEDGIHDPANTGTHALQPPLTALGGMNPLGAGNRVNWVSSLEAGKIKPRWDRDDPNANAVVMDLNIVREVKGSMPDVVYPHKQHTEWLDCSNCHPQIFIPQKGANQISMASIMLGQKCGVCHGKVAFPVSECRLCHSKKKDNQAPAAALAGTRP